MKLQFTKLVSGTALLCIALASCQKNESVTSKPASQTNSPLTRTTTMIGAMQNESDLEVADIFATNVTDAAHCPVTSYNPAKGVYPDTRTVDYGSGCTDDYGVTRSGKRFTTIYGDKFTAPAGKTISVTTFSNYYVNGVNITGNVKISIMSPASPGPLMLRILVAKTVTDAYGNTSSYVNSATQTQIAGGETDSLEDNVFKISENSYGSEISGDSAMITWKSVSDPANPMIKMALCPYRSKGGEMITLKQLGVTTDEYLDYGNGDCDNQATLSVNNGTPQPVTLPLYFFGTDL
ncbi:MAG: hypothetical protein ABJB05_10495 [Parafilimonas sp.]